MTTKSAWRTLIESTPPNRQIRLPGIIKETSRHDDLVMMESVYLHCENCKGPRWFDFQGSVGIGAHSVCFFVHYQCKNCSEFSKSYAISLYRTAKRSTDATGEKLGESPPFGPHVPAKVISLLGKSRQLFLSGRQVESLGFGIGAFAYYRQVVEDQKDELIGAIRTTSEQLSAPADFIHSLDAAAREKRFSEAVTRIKDGIPTALLILGHNPLTLLHDALSRGLHAGTDEECLNAARAIREIITALADRMAEIRKDQSHLKAALSTLFRNRPDTETKTPADKK